MSERSSGQHGGDSGPWTMGNLDVVRSAPAAPDALALWTKVGLACLFLAVATPLVGLGGLWATALLGRLAATGLEASHAKLPALGLTADWDLRLAYVLALAVMGMRAGVSRLPRPTWRAAGLGPWHWWLLLGGGLWLASGAALVFERQLVDIADTVHLMVLGGTWLWTTATAMWLIASLGRAGVVLLAVAAQRSRIVSGSVAVVGLASMVIVAPVLANPDEILVADVRRNAPLLAAALDDVAAVERSLQRLAAGGSRSSLALLPTGGSTTPALPPAGGGSVGDDRYTTAQCMDELVTRSPSKPLSPVDEVIENITRRLRDRDLARDIVHTKLLKICTKKPKRQGELVKLLQRAATFGAVDVQRDAHRVLGLDAPGSEAGDLREHCSSFTDRRPDEETSFEDVLHERTMIEAAMKRLSVDDQGLIRERYFEDRDYEEMAAERDAKKDTIARRTTRAVERLGEHMHSACL